MTFRFLQLALVFSLVLTAAAAEFPVSDVVLGDPPGSRGSFVAASDGDGFLAAWLDYRGVDVQLLAARITGGGQVLDPAGLSLLRNVGGRPQVLWNGEHYLVFVERNFSLVVIEVHRDGTFSAPRTLLENVHIDSFHGSQIATNGSRIVMVYGDRSGFNTSPSKLRVGVFTMDAELIRETVVQEADPVNVYLMTRLLPSVAVNNGQFAVAWNLFPVDQQLHLTGVRLGADGSIMDAQPRAIGKAGLESIIEPHGTGYLAISTFFSWAVSRDLSTFTLPAEMSIRAPYTGAIVIQRNGVATLFGLRGPMLSAAEFDAAGHVMPVQNLDVPSSGPLAVASNGSDLAVFWLDEGTTAVRTSVFNEATLQRKSDIAPLTESASLQFDPAVAASDSGMLVAWRETDGVYAGRVLADGTRLDGPGVRLSDGVYDGAPAVLFDGQHYVVAFMAYHGHLNSEVIVRFFSPTGGLLPNEIRIPSGDAGLEVALAKSDNAVLLVWKDDLWLYGSRINAEMQLIDPPIGITSGALASPMAAWNGREFLIAWRTARWDFDYINYPSIAGTRFSASLTPIESAPRTLVQVPEREHVNASLAWNGSHWVVAFETWRFFSADPHEVRVVVVDGGGSLISGGPAIPGKFIANGFAPRLVTAGSRTWLAWKEDTNDRALRLVALKFDGSIDPVQQQRIAAPTPLDPNWKERFGIAAKGTQVVLAYPRFAGADAGFVPRVYATITGAVFGGRRRAAGH